MVGHYRLLSKFLKRYSRTWDCSGDGDSVSENPLVIFRKNVNLKKKMILEKHKNSAGYLSITFTARHEGGGGRSTVGIR